MQKLQIRETIGKAAILLTAIFLTAIFPAGCAQGGGFSMGGSGDRLRETGDHIAMEAAQGTAAETIRKDAQIIEERLRSFAGEGSYRVETTLPDGQTDAGPATSGRIDIYLDPALKGEESLSYLARVYVSGNLRYALYSIEKGFLNEQEGYYLTLSPEDLLSAEVTECPEAFRTSDHGEAGTAVKICLADNFWAEHGKVFEEWTQGVGLVADIREKSWESQNEFYPIDNMRLMPSEESGVFYIVNSGLKEREKENLAASLGKEPLSGSYRSSVRPACLWDLTAADAGQLKFLRTHEELLSMAKDMGRETVLLTFPPYDKGMEDDVRAKLVQGLCLRLDALGMPYSVGEVADGNGAIAVETLPDHMTAEVREILQIASPLNLAAEAAKLPLEGGKFRAEVISLENGNLALDLVLSSGGKDKLQRMSASLEEGGGGEILIYLKRKTPICAAYTDQEVRDGHLVLDRNYTGIGGSSWNAENRWILDLVCTALNNEPYPAQKVYGFLNRYYYDQVFERGEYSALDSAGLVCAPPAAGFSDDTVLSETLEMLHSFAPAASIPEKSEFDSYYGIYTIRLGLDLSAEELAENSTAYLAEVYHLIRRGPILNARVFLTKDDEEALGMHTYWESEEIRIEPGSDFTEEFMANRTSRTYRSSPGMMFRGAELAQTLQDLEEMVR